MKQITTMFGGRSNRKPSAPQKSKKTYSQVNQSYLLSHTASSITFVYHITMSISITILTFILLYLLDSITFFQFGLMDVADITDLDNDDDFDDNDEDLEAELLALTSDPASKPRKPGMASSIHRKPNNSPLHNCSLLAKPVVREQDLQSMIQDSLRDIPSDEDVSSGEDDPNLLVSSAFNASVLPNSSYSTISISGRIRRTTS